MLSTHTSDLVVLVAHANPMSRPALEVELGRMRQAPAVDFRGAAIAVAATNKRVRRDFIFGR